MKADKQDIATAVFGLGLFIDGRLRDTMPPEEIYDFMEVYLRLFCQLQGREYHACRELQSRIAVVSQMTPQEVRQWTPAWLHDGEILRGLLQQLDTSPNNASLDG